VLMIIIFCIASSAWALEVLHLLLWLFFTFSLCVYYTKCGSRSTPGLKLHQEKVYRTKVLENL